MKPAADRRIGRFHVTTMILEDGLTDRALREVMNQVIVLDARASFPWGVVEYTALSEHFAELPFGHLPPLYDVLITDRGEEQVPTVEWRQRT